MKLKTKIIAIALCATMVVGGVVGGSLAYFTDTDGEANVFTTGNVDIDLTEDFEQGSTLVPGVDINKDVQITNTGKGDAWVWYTYAIPSALDTAGDASENAIHVNHAGQNWDKYYTEGNTKGYEGTATSLEETWNVDYNPNGENGTPIGTVEIDGVEYNVYAVLYNGILKKGETTTVGMTKVYLDKHVDIDTDGNWTKVENGDVTKLEWSDADGNPIIYVNAYGIQAEGFATVEAAYDAYIGQWGELTELVKNVTPATLVETEKELQAALDNGEDVALTGDDYTTLNTIKLNVSTLNGNGRTVKKEYAEGAATNVAVHATGGTIENLDIDNGTPDAAKGLRAIYVTNPTADLYVKGCNLDATYCININSSTNDYGLYVSDSMLNGWTSYGAAKEAVFTNCKFGMGKSGFNNLRPYADTTLTDCDFDSGFTITCDKNLSKQFTITLNNCYVGNEKVTAVNFLDLLGGADDAYALKNHEDMVTVIVNGEEVPLNGTFG